MRQAKIGRRSGGDERGAVLIEFALVLPFLALLFIGIVDLGWAIRAHQVLQNAAREGARFSSLPHNCVNCRPTDCSGSPDTGCKTQAQVLSEIKTRVINYLANEGMTVTAEDITIDQCGEVTIDDVVSNTSVVTISYTHSLLIGSLIPGGELSLTGQAMFLNLYGANCN